jgi:hypothetical protein
MKDAAIRIASSLDGSGWAQPKDEFPVLIKRRWLLKGKFLRIVALGIGALTLSLPLSAHHGNAAYDYTATKTVKGTVTEWTWRNPHCLLKLDSKDDKGNITHWILEASSPVDMLHAGWAATTFMPGDEITVDLMPTKDGVTVGRIRRVVLPDGKVLVAGGRYTL